MAPQERDVTKPAKPEQKILCKNSRARFDYEIDEAFEAGIALVGSEVKSLRDGGAVLTDAFAEVRGGELWLVAAKIAVYPYAHARNHDPVRDRRLLMHKREILRLQVKIREKGYTLIPLSFYLKDGRVKVELGLAKGKKKYDKRTSEREKTEKRELRQVTR
jgi:SsrA-binding protein